MNTQEQQNTVPRPYPQGEPYAERDNIVRAIRWDGTNHEQVLRFCNGKGGRISLGAVDRGLVLQYSVLNGDTVRRGPPCWAVYHSSGHLDLNSGDRAPQRLLSDEEFKTHYIHGKCLVMPH